MKAMLTNTCLLFLIIISNACTKETFSTPVNAVLSNNVSSATANLVGRQHQITLATGDPTYPTSQALLWLPVDYNSIRYDSINHYHRNHEKYPLLICLVGSGETGTDINLLLGTENVSKRIADGWNAIAINPITKKTTKFIVFTPQCPASFGWSAKQVKKMLAELEDTYRIDETRIYITGYSAGGWGLWSCITDDNSLCKQFAAIGPVSSASADNPNKITNVDKNGIACWSICGTQDAFYSNSVDYTNIINSNNPPVKAILTSLKGVGHSAWYQAYDPNWRANGLNFYEWLLKYHL